MPGGLDAQGIGTLLPKSPTTTSTPKPSVDPTRSPSGTRTNWTDIAIPAGATTSNPPPPPPVAGPTDPLDRLGTLFASAFGQGAGTVGGSNQPLVAVPVGGDAASGDSSRTVGIVVVLALAAGAAYWYTHRKAVA